MRRILSAFFLLLFMVGAQQSALVHEIGHGVGEAPSGNLAAGAAAADSGIEKARPDSSDTRTYCEKCFHFAHVAGAVAGHLPGALRLDSRGEQAQATLAAAVAADAPQSRSRGPPVIL
jgi:hypothetical protein